MKVKDLIAQLEKYHDPEEHIIVAYWQQEAFPDVEGEHWNDLADTATDDMDWSRAHEEIGWFMDETMHYEGWNKKQGD
jgi:hypothetical protein